MKRFSLPTIAVFTILAGGFAAAGAVSAANAGDHCKSIPADQWKPISAVVDMAKGEGWTLTEIQKDDGCWEVEGTTADGYGFEAKLRPDTLAMRKFEYDDDHGPVPATQPAIQN